MSTANGGISDRQLESQCSTMDSDRTANESAPTAQVIGEKLTRGESAKRAAHDLENFQTSPLNPRNWTNRKKWRIALTIALTGFISTSGSSMAVPGIHASMQEFGIENDKIGIFVTTFYVLGLGVGPFLFAPLSELYGRQAGFLASLAPYCLFSIGCAVSQNFATLAILRFFCGCFGSCGPALGVASCADMFAPHQRGRPISIYSIGPMAGPVLGSMLGYWILLGGWRWLYWTISFLAIANFIIFNLLTEETYAPVIEKRLRYAASHPGEEPQTFAERYSFKRLVHSLGWARTMVSRQDAAEVFGKAFSRPPRLLFTNPVCIIFSLYYAYIYAIIYVFIISVPFMFGSPPFSRPGLFSYMWPNYTVSLSYLGQAVGLAIAATTAATCQDRIYKYLSKRAGDINVGQPEYRLVLTQIGMCLLPIGLLIFGWSGEKEVHWIAPQIGQTIILLGLMLAFNSIQNFIVDAFFPYSAAGVAAATACRSTVACILPEFTGDLFTNLGWGWAGTLLALVAALGVPAPLIMFKWGRKLREKYKFEG